MLCRPDQGDNVCIRHQVMSFNEIINNEIFKLADGKGMGPDGWCEELLMILRKIGGAATEDLKMVLRICTKFAQLPRYIQGALMKPILKDGKKGVSHNEYRKLSLLSVIRKKVEKIGSLMMRRVWASGDYQGGFKKGKRTAGRIFILLAAIAEALWPSSQDVQPQEGSNERLQPPQQGLRQE